MPLFEEMDHEQLLKYGAAAGLTAAALYKLGKEIKKKKIAKKYGGENISPDKKDTTWGLLKDRLKEERYEDYIEAMMNAKSFRKDSK